MVPPKADKLPRVQVDKSRWRFEQPVFWNSVAEYKYIIMLLLLLSHA